MNQYTAEVWRKKNQEEHLNKLFIFQCLAGSSLCRLQTYFNMHLLKLSAGNVFLGNRHERLVKRILWGKVFIHSVRCLFIKLSQREQTRELHISWAWVCGRSAGSWIRRQGQGPGCWSATSKRRRDATVCILRIVWVIMWNEQRTGR